MSTAQPVAAASPDLLQPQLESATAEERIRWGLETFGERVVLSTSFGVQAAVMLHLVSRQAPGIPVVFIDTGYHFPETYRFADELVRRLDLNLKVYQPLMTAARQEALYGERWKDGLDGLKAYNFDNKVEPMDRAIRELNATAWFAGLRRSQATTREVLPVVHTQAKITKIYPIIDWDNRAIHRYLTANDLPYHPLWEKGYVSIGDWHSTSRLEAGMTEEQTRFGGVKRECGLHESSGRDDFQI